MEVRVRRLNEPMLNMRKGVAVYTRPVADLALGNPEWVQQAIVAPASHQGSDLFGAHQIHVRGTFAIVSAANRDSLATGTNSGGAFMFNLDFLSLKFSQKNYIVNENIPGGKQNITIQRCMPYCLAGSGNYSSFVEYQIGWSCNRSSRDTLKTKGKLTRHLMPLFGWMCQLSHRPSGLFDP